MVVAWWWNQHSTVSAPSAKASRSNGPRSAPGIAVQKEEWDCLKIMHIHVCIYMCIYSYICMSVVHQPAIHEDQMLQSKIEDLNCFPSKWKWELK